MKNLFNKSFSPKGFTLIELLIVIAVLGVLAAIVLIAINPGEQIARGKDASRLQVVAQLGHAMQAYFTNQGSLPVYSNAWQQALISSGDLNTIQAAPDDGNAVCAASYPYSQNRICYASSGTDFAIWTGVESKQYKVKAGGGAECVSPPPRSPYFIYTSVLGRAGVGCWNPNTILPPIMVSPLN